MATWNVNSVSARLPRLLPWLDERAPDVVCLQETKLSDEAFSDALAAPLAERGYAVAPTVRGSGTGSRCCRASGSTTWCAGCPTSPLPVPGRPRRRPRDHRDLRRTARDLGVRAQRAHARDPHYAYKLEWLAALRASVTDPTTAVVAGDYNIAPTDDDVWDPALFVTPTHVTPAERKALAELPGSGCTTSSATAGPPSACSPTGTTAPAASTRTSGCASTWCSPAPPRRRTKAVWIDRKARKGKGPSDHAPVIVDLDNAPDGDLGPVVPPPSAPAPSRRR